MGTLTNLVSSLAMGVTIYIGEKTGERDNKAGGLIVGAGILLFLAIGSVFTVLIPIFAPQLSALMHAPAEAFDLTTSYIRICGAGMIVIIAYNLIGSIFRGLGDSHTPLVTVAIACVCNIAGDLLLVAGFNMGTAGAAIATVAAQMISVVISFLLIRRKTLPFDFSREYIRWDGNVIGKIIMLGIPIALQDLLVGISFLVVLAIVNGLGLIASAGVSIHAGYVGLRCAEPRRGETGQSVQRPEIRNYGILCVRSDNGVRLFLPRRKSGVHICQRR